LKSRYFEDFIVGERFTTATYEVNAEEIVAFARQYDPQPFHLDLDSASRSIFGELVASGWHTTAIAMRLIVESRVLEATGVIGLGIDELRWPNALRPGDKLVVRCTVVGKEPSRSGKPRGTLRVKQEMFNQRDACVLSQTAILLVACRPQA
jgi:acyl dehydratase